MKLKKAAKKSITLLPKFIRYKAYRNLAVGPTTLPPNMRFKLARTKEELSQALSILHDAYVNVGLMEPHYSGMRATIYHALPSTSTLIAVLGDEVIGTVSLIRDNILGLPSDDIVDLTEYRKKEGVRMAEISALAIKKGYRGQFYVPFLKFTYQYAYKYFGLDYMLAVLTTPTRGHEYFESIFSFNKIEDNVVKDYSFSNNIPVVGEVLDLKKAPFELARYYAHKRPEKNLFRYFFEHESANFIFPDRTFNTITDPVMTPYMMDIFFNVKSDTFKKLSPRQIQALHLIYEDYPSYKHVLPPLEVISGDPGLSRKDSIGHELKCKGQLYTDRGRSVLITATEGSRQELRARVENPSELNLSETITAKIVVGQFLVATLTIRPIRKIQGTTYQFRIDDASREWSDFMDYLEISFFPKKKNNAPRRRQAG